MNARKLIPILVLCVAARSHALNEESIRAGDELVTTLKQEMKELAAEDGVPNDVAAIRNYMQRVQAALVQDRFRSINQALDNPGNFDPSEEVQKGIDSLRKAIRDEYQGNTDAVISDLAAIIDAARQKVRRAEEPEELDKTLESLSKTRFTNGRNGETYDTNDSDVRALFSEMTVAWRFVTSWQDYLQASNTGDYSRAMEALLGLADDEITLIPRSQIISRIAFEREGGDELARTAGSIDSLDEMKGAIAKLAAKVGKSRSSRSDNAAIKKNLQSLARLEKVYREFLAGMPVNVEVLSISPTSSDLVEKLDFIDLRAQLLLLVLPRYLDLPEDFKADKGETVDHFMGRAMDDAAARSDTAACRRIKNTSLMLVSSSRFRQADLDALRDYAAGQSQLEAGQHMLAVVSLQEALSFGSELIPAAETGEMLKKLREKHPEEYEQGMLEFLTDHPKPEIDYSRMSYRRYRAPYMRDGREGGTTVVLPVPAKTANPEQEAGAPPESGAKK